MRLILLFLGFLFTFPNFAQDIDNSFPESQFITEKNSGPSSIVLLVDKIIVFNSLNDYNDQTDLLVFKKHQYTELQEGIISVYKETKFIKRDTFYLGGCAIKFKSQPNSIYHIEIESRNCAPTVHITLETNEFNLGGTHNILIGTSSNNNMDNVIGYSEYVPNMIRLLNSEEVENYEKNDKNKINNELKLEYDSESKTFIDITDRNEKTSLLSYKGIKEKWKETVNNIIEKVDFTKKDSTDDNSVAAETLVVKPVVPKNDSKIQSSNQAVSKIKKVKNDSSNTTNIYSFLAGFEELEMEQEIMMDTAKIEEKKKFVELQQNKIKDGWRNAKTREDTLMLLSAEQQLKNVEASISLLEDKLKKSDELAITNKKLLEQEKLRSEAMKSKGQILFTGIALTLILLVIIIYFLLKSKKLNTKVKITLAQVEEQNEELNQTNEALATQRDQIEKQRHNLETAHNEIKDSINYAKRIQSAILPPPSLLNEYFSNHLILYKPKDVVAGDFYWLEKSGDTTLIAAADCTGHGVPGAMVSVVCHNALNRSVREFGLTNPGKILDRSREIVLDEFSKSENNVQDGMDIALCALTGMELKYAGANNPLWIIRNGELLETKADKQPIGKFDKIKNFNTHTINLQQDDIIYIFSDGYQDQFGGDRDRKFGTKRLKELLLSIHHKPMDDQREILDQTLQDWMKDCFIGQLDDICLIGLKI